MTTARKPILVTGASGFIGGHLCAALASRGDAVKALYRRKEPPASLRELARSSGGLVELFNADLSDRTRVREAVSGVRAVIHSAALASDWGSLDLFMAANYEATVSLLEAARGAGAEAFVYFSSAVVHGFGPHIGTTERGPYFPLKYPYQITKLMTEEYVLAQHGASFKTTAIRPCNVYGAGDRMSTYQMFDAATKGAFGYIGSGGQLTCPIYIDDLCAGTLAALDRRESGGEAILLTDGQKVSWKDYARAMYAAIGSKRKPVSAPKPLAFAAAWLMSAAALAVRSASRPLLTLYPVEQGSQDYHFSNEKARELLGFAPTVFYEEGLRRTARAFLDDRNKGDSP